MTETYTLENEWPEEWMCSTREVGALVVFEAIRRESATFIRGNGTTASIAEANAWRQYKNIIACTGHIFDDRGYTTGVGWCVHCDMFSPKAFEPARQPCQSCGRPTDFLRDSDGKVWCMNDWQLVPPGLRSDAWTTFYNRPAVLAGYITDYRSKFKEPTV
jgi:hypothetical protein